MTVFSLPANQPETFYRGAGRIAAFRSGPALPDRPDTGILVKLLAAGQRLPLHVHPDRHFAHEHLASPYGKTEAWVIVSAEPDAVVHLGFARDVSPGELAAWVREQDVDAMLAATNRVPISAGDALLCPA